MSGIIVLGLRLVLAACLYFFLGWALFTLWKDLQTHGVSLAIRKTPPLSLTLHHAGGETSQRAFHQSDISIGRDPACDLSLNDDGVSARHARLSFHHGQWWAEDLGSTNGTRLNQSALATPTVLTSGDQIECGHTAIIVSIGAAIDPSPTIRL
ncbi:MAG: FHA domain-containing protein [Anaerolineaceae bacterium]|nr:MAG: FHA domain-containing protein [Anaerolineaceae bacterium]